VTSIMERSSGPASVIAETPVVARGASWAGAGICFPVRGAALRLWVVCDEYMREGNRTRIGRHLDGAAMHDTLVALSAGRLPLFAAWVRARLGAVLGTCFHEAC
jgi:hypothetical protein